MMFKVQTLKLEQWFAVHPGWEATCAPLQGEPEPPTAGRLVLLATVRSRH